ncbi:hypothetical protein SLE2022_133080 [Rubroshorea leprosula]
MVRVCEGESPAIRKILRWRGEKGGRPESMRRWSADAVERGSRWGGERKWGKSGEGEVEERRESEVSPP